jgi:hypothetical protein
MALQLPQLPGKTRRRKSPSDIVTIDLGTTGLKVVRIKRAKDGLTAIGVDILPPITFAGQDAGTKPKLELPKTLLTNYAALTLGAESAVVRILSLPPKAEQPTEEQVREQVGLGPEFRVSFAVVSVPRPKAETKLLVVGVPEKDAQAVLSMVAVGVPAPFSLEAAGLPALTAYLKGPGVQHTQDAIGVVEAGARLTFLALFQKETLVLVRKFDFGGDALVAKVQQQLGVDRDTAQGIISDGSFDISQPVHDVMDPFLRQLTISKDFVERREDCHISRIYVSGGPSLSQYWTDAIQNAAGVEVMRWNPFDSLRLAEGAYPANLQGQQTRFATAIGAGLGVFHES